MLYSLAASWLTLATVSTAITTLPAEKKKPSVSRRWLLGDDKIRGVNLGSLFIVEEWFAKDDYGLNTIRIPVGFWIKEGLVQSDEYYPRGGLKYLDRVVCWARDAGLYIVIDLHGGPSSQSPNEEFTGHTTANPGFFTDVNYKRANKFLEWITERIHTNDAYSTVGMVEIINEPIKRRVNATDAYDMVKNFYPTAWDRIRDRESKLGLAIEDLLHIQYMFNDWRWSYKAAVEAGAIPKDASILWDCSNILGEEYPLEKAVFYTDPFYVECRAYGRIKEAMDQGEIKGKIATKCHEYIFLGPDAQKWLEDEGIDLGTENLNEELLPITGGARQPRVIVKDFEIAGPDVDKQTPQQIRKCFRNVWRLNQLGIYNRDVRAEVFRTAEATRAEDEVKFEDMLEEVGINLNFLATKEFNFRPRLKQFKYEGDLRVDNPGGKGVK
ncbi:hypothetical protein CIB48_g2713 [Xylaria polymorpha]|nr:hypothetical protein CIB48_g2713 [Xylaria polymorpha]